MAKIIGKPIFRNYVKREEAMIETWNNCPENKLRENEGMKVRVSRRKKWLIKVKCYKELK